MSTSPSIDPNIAAPESAATPLASSRSSTPDVLLCVPSMSVDALQTLLATVTEAFPGDNVLLVSPDRAAEELTRNVHVVPLNAHSHQGWVLNAGDYANAGQLTREHRPSALLLLGYDAASLSAHKMREMVDSVRQQRDDLVLPRPATAPDEGLVNSALLYPLTRALFGSDIHFPLPVHAALSPRMAERLGTVAQRQASVGQSEALLWPVAEAALAGFIVREASIGEATLPRPPQDDFNTLFAAVANSLFADLESKAAFWQRARSFSTNNGASHSNGESSSAASPEARSLVDAFRLAYANLYEIWSLVLPPQTLLALKRLSQATPDAFSIAPSLWARIVYDFALGFRLRTINRGHLIGAFTPLYLAWVASHVRSVESDPVRAKLRIAETASAFELEKPYLVSRWRWPDRFNP